MSVARPSLKVSTMADTYNAENALPPSMHTTPRGMTALSPKSTNIQTSSSQDQLFQLQIEIQSLKQRLKLSSSTNKNELLELVSEKETVIQSKSKQISTLNEKFHKITKAVAQMEREVAILRKDNEDMESDNKKLKRHLNIREKEVTALVTRCTVQEEKLAELKDARVLEKQLVDVKGKLTRATKDLEEMETLQQTLMRSEKEREGALRRIDVLSKEKEELAVNLNAKIAEDAVNLSEKKETLAKLEQDFRTSQELNKKQEAECQRLSQSLNECVGKIDETDRAMIELKSTHASKVDHLQHKLEEQMTHWTKMRNDAIAALKAEHDEELLELKLEIKSREDSMAGMCKDIASIKTHNEGIRQELKQCKQEKIALEEKIETKETTYEEEINNVRIELEAKTAEVVQFKKSMEGLQKDKSSLNVEVNILGDRVASLENDIEVHEREMEEIEITNAKTREELQRKVKDLENSNRMEKGYQEKIAKLEKDKVAVKEEYEAMLLDSEEQFKDMDKHFETEREKVEKLRSEMNQITSHAERQEELRQMEMKLLEDSVAAAKLQADTKERDFNAKSEELRSERDKVSKLEASLQTLKKTSSRAEMDAAMIVEEMNQKLEASAIENKKLEKERDGIVADSRKAIDGLKNKISDLEEEFTNLKGEIVSKESQLEQKQSTINSLMKSKGELENKIKSYRTDLDMLMKAYDETKDEYSGVVLKLEEEKKRLKQERERENSEFKKDYEQLQLMATESQEELEKNLTSNATMKRTLEERVSMIDELVNCNKNLERDLNAKNKLISDLQLGLDEGKKENEEIKKRYSRIRIEKNSEINSHLDSLEIEKSSRVALEMRVKRLEDELEEKKKQIKTTAELRAANYLLQDKIDRQDAFLKKKLQQAKVKKERSLAPSSTMKSPPRPSSGRSRSITRRPVDKIRGTSTSSRRSSSIPRRAVPDELDELLNDEF